MPTTVHRAAILLGFPPLLVSLLLGTLLLIGPSSTTDVGAPGSVREIIAPTALFLGWALVYLALVLLLRTGRRIVRGALTLWAAPSALVAATILAVLIKHVATVGQQAPRFGGAVTVQVILAIAVCVLTIVCTVVGLTWLHSRPSDPHFAATDVRPTGE